MADKTQASQIQRSKLSGSSTAERPTVMRGEFGFPTDAGNPSDGYPVSGYGGPADTQRAMKNQIIGLITDIKDKDGVYQAVREVGNYHGSFGQVDPVFIDQAMKLLEISGRQYGFDVPSAWRQYLAPIWTQPPKPPQRTR